MTDLPERTESHQTDTLATKKISALLGNLMVRTSGDRDYGIDLLVENYDQENAGQFLFFQVKGTSKAVSPMQTDLSVVALGNFPKKTLIYAEACTYPFIATYTSIKNGGAIDTSPAYYVWLQRYIEYYLNVQQPDWRRTKEDNLTLYIPVSNVIAGENDRLRKIAEASVQSNQATRFIMTAVRLQALISSEKLDKLYFDELHWILLSLQRCRRITAPYDVHLEVDSLLNDLYSKKTEGFDNNLLADTLSPRLSTFNDDIHNILSEVLVSDTYPSQQSW
jgi:hypothetical protein